MESANQIRADIVEILSKIENVAELKALHFALDETYRSNARKASNIKPNFMNGVKKVRENVSLEEIIKEQQYLSLIHI